MYRVRSRLVNFRVTPEEFAQLKASAALQGARCLSDFARNTILASAWCPPAPNDGSVDAVLAGFDRRLTALEASLERLSGAFSQGLTAIKSGD